MTFQNRQNSRTVMDVSTEAARAGAGDRAAGVLGAGVLAPNPGSGYREVFSLCKLVSSTWMISVICLKQRFFKKLPPAPSCHGEQQLSRQE